MTQTVLVTGAAAGLGNVIATSLLKQGYQVVLTDVDATRAREAAARLDGGQDRVLALGLDICQPQDFADALDATITRFGSLDVLVNNAALTLATPVMEIAVEEFDRVIATNLRGTFVGCQTMGRYFATRGYGRIINLASLAGHGAERRHGLRCPLCGLEGRHPDPDQNLCPRAEQIRRDGQCHCAGALGSADGSRPGAGREDGRAVADDPGGHIR